MRQVEIANAGFCPHCQVVDALRAPAFRCSTCRKFYRRGPKYSGKGMGVRLRYLVLVRGEFQGASAIPARGFFGLPTVRIRPLVWKADGEFVYFPCSKCGEIQKIFRSDIARSGRLKKSKVEFCRGDGSVFTDWVNPCTHCNHCDSSTWVYFEGIAKEALGGPKRPQNRVR